MFFSLNFLEKAKYIDLFLVVIIFRGIDSFRIKSQPHKEIMAIQVLGDL